MAAIRASKRPPSSMPSAPDRTNYVLGSRPAVMRSPSLTRIKPVSGQTQYAKNPLMATLGQGNTGMTGET